MTAEEGLQVCRVEQGEACRHCQQGRLSTTRHRSSVVSEVVLSLVRQEEEGAVKEATQPQEE